MPLKLPASMLLKLCLFNHGCFNPNDKDHKVELINHIVNPVKWSLYTVLVYN